MLALDFTKFPQLRTPRLLLRAITHSDDQAVFQLRGNADVMEHIGKHPATTVEEAAEFVSAIIHGLEANEGITWGIAIAAEPQNLVGTIGFWKIQPAHYRAEIGYLLHPSLWKKGIMQEAMEAVLDFGFQQLGLHSVEAQISPKNTASEKTLLTNGFVKEAYYKENFFFNGRFWDTAVFSRLNPHKNDPSLAQKEGSEATSK